MSVIGNPIRRASDRFFGDGSHAVTVPTMDGPLKPNSELDNARLVVNIPSPDNLIVNRNRLFFSSQNIIYRVDADGSEEHEVTKETESDITALAAGPNGLIAVAGETGTIEIFDPDHKSQQKGPFVHKFDTCCITAMAFISSSKLAVSVGSQINRASDWARDLMECNAAGSVYVLDLENGSCRTLVSNLAYPSGLLPDNEGLLVCEAWRSRILRISINGRPSKPQTVLEQLPAYPSRMCPTGDGFWLCLFAPRSRLIELVLREKRYRKRMLAEVSPELWIAPMLRSGVSMHEPMQGGALRHLGFRKPWAPSLSCGLIAKLDTDLNIVESLHSRSDGFRHGITSAVNFDSHLFISSRGGDAVIAV